MGRLATHVTAFAAAPLGIFGGPAGVRTLDPKIKSLVLYQLSYRPAAAPPTPAAPPASNAASWLRPPSAAS